MLCNSILSRDEQVLMKYQANKLIDLVEPNLVKFTEKDSEVNNQPSIDDIHDYNAIPNQDTARSSVYQASKKGEKVTAAGSDIELKIGTFLS